MNRIESFICYAKVLIQYFMDNMKRCVVSPKTRVGILTRGEKYWGCLIKIKLIERTFKTETT